MSNKKTSLESLYSSKVKSSFVYKINKLFTLYKAQTSKYFSTENLGYSEITTINIIGQLGGQTTLSEITSVHWIDAGLVSRISKMLENKGFLKKVQKLSDKRSNSLILTEKGKKIFQKIEIFNKTRRNSILKNFSPESRKGVIVLLDSLIEATLLSSKDISLT
jgi:DNA-binding MarR family transcriptional regulator